jgi:hypothetical protein
MALEWASDELRNDQEVVLAAVGQDGSALQYASDELRKVLGARAAGARRRRRVCRGRSPYIPAPK